MTASLLMHNSNKGDYSQRK